MPVGMRSSSTASTSASDFTSLDEASDWKRLAAAFSTTVSTSVFQAPQAGHWPCHLGELPPHSVQVY